MSDKHTFEVPVYYEMMEYMKVEAPKDTPACDLRLMAEDQFNIDDVELDPVNYIEDSEKADRNAPIADLTVSRDGRYAIPESKENLLLESHNDLLRAIRVAVGEMKRLGRSEQKISKMLKDDMKEILSQAFPEKEQGR